VVIPEGLLGLSSRYLEAAALPGKQPNKCFHADFDGVVETDQCQAPVSIAVSR